MSRRDGGRAPILVPAGRWDGLRARVWWHRKRRAWRAARVSRRRTDAEGSPVLDRRERRVLLEIAWRGAADEEAYGEALAEALERDDADGLTRVVRVEPITHFGPGDHLRSAAMDARELFETIRKGPEGPPPPPSPPPSKVSRDANEGNAILILAAGLLVAWAFSMLGIFRGCGS